MNKHKKIENRNFAR